MRYGKHKNPVLGEGWRSDLRSDVCIPMCRYRLASIRRASVARPEVLDASFRSVPRCAMSAVV